MPKLLSTSFVFTDIGRGGRPEGNSRQPPHLLNENRILCIQYELSCWGEKTFLLIPMVTKLGWQLQIQSKKTFQRYPFRKNLTDVTLVWGDCQHLKKHTKCSYQEPYQLVSGIRLYSAHLPQLNTNLPPMSTTKIFSSKWLNIVLESDVLRRNISEIKWLRWCTSCL